MDSAHCPRCFHIIGEHLYCKDHGGVFESAKVDKTPPKPLDPCPPEAIYDLNHVWWNFLDAIGVK
jgi:hypothetical protein